MNGFKDLVVYNIAREIEKESWNVYQNLDLNNKIIFGNQLIISIDSIGANIAEGFGRYHYLDSVKFYYNARGSLFEGKHRIEILEERKIISQEIKEPIIQKLELLGVKLNNFIRKTKEINTNINRN